MNNLTLMLQQSTQLQRLHQLNRQKGTFIEFLESINSVVSDIL